MSERQSGGLTMQTCPKCGEQDDWLQKCTRCGEEWRESSIPSTDLLCEIIRIADHQIPFYAYGDNQAACDMDNRLQEIYTTLTQYTHNAQ